MTAVASPRSFLMREISKLRDALEELEGSPYPELLAETAAAFARTITNGGKIMFCGNGGSAADAQHLAAELVGRQNFDRPPTAALALTVDSSILTALANDYGYETVFSRQVEALGKPGDILVGSSTSGRSRNVVHAFTAARELGITTVAMTGRNPRDMGVADLVLAMPASETSKIQELHIVCGHMVCALVETSLFG
jgi:D-sedoheptulose 7-phosphate isomerase